MSLGHQQTADTSPASSHEVLQASATASGASAMLASLLALPEVADAFLATAPDWRSRERTVAHVVPASGAQPSLEDVRAALSGSFAQSDLPTVLHLHESLPRTADGLIDAESLPGVPGGPNGRAIEMADYLPIMRAMADAVSGVLGLDDIGPDDDFFDLGGTMRSAVSVARELERVLARPVSARLVFKAPTPRLMNEALESQEQAQTDHLVDLQPLGDRPPLFCMPDLYGRPLSFITMAGRIDKRQPVIGLAVGPALDVLDADRSLGGLCEAYVAAILERRPAGPFRIVGYSFGGAFAQETARRLHELGHDVSLVLVDAPNRAVGLKPGWLALGAVRTLAVTLVRAGPVAAARKLVRRSRHLAAFARGSREAVMPRWVPPADLRISCAHHDSWRDHRPKPFDGRTLMILCAQHDEINTFRHLDGMLGWRGLLRGPVERIVADVGHQEIVRAGYVDQLIAEMEAFFDAATAQGDRRP